MSAALSQTETAMLFVLNKFAEQEKIEFVLSCSADPANAPESVKKFLI